MRRITTTLLLSVLSIPVLCEIRLPRWESSTGIDGLTTCDFKVQGDYPPFSYSLRQIESAPYASKYNTQGGMSETFPDVPAGKYILTVTDRERNTEEFPIEIRCEFDLKTNDDTVVVKVPCDGGSEGIDIPLNPAENDFLVVKSTINNNGTGGRNHSVAKTNHEVRITSKPNLPLARIFTDEDGQMVYHLTGDINPEGDRLTYELSSQGIQKEGTIVIQFKMEKPQIKEIELDRNTATLIVEGGTPDYTFFINDSIESSSNKIYNLPFGQYTATAIDAQGCKSESKNFFVNKEIYPSKFFTPNGDGINDTWGILNIEEYKKFKIQIIDRRGVVLKEYINEYIPWDGTYNGTDMPSTDYWFIMTSDETDQDFSGHFTLLRSEE
ncbi:MAG: T9SS type B sorting domain-containing protein [Paludibacteraceae bacterium]|nr:T9SS type B sorting domain-containing protein [Paludibacteraceae bacterium]